TSSNSYTHSLVLNQDTWYLVNLQFSTSQFLSFSINNANNINVNFSTITPNLITGTLFIGSALGTSRFLTADLAGIYLWKKQLSTDERSLIYNFGLGYAVSASKLSLLTLGSNTTITPRLALANNFSSVLTANTTVLAPTGKKEGEEFKLILIQDATGGRTVTWNSNYIFSGTPPLVTTANAVNIYEFVIINDKAYCLKSTTF
ncbi:MAG: hypothetical protein ACRC80_01440, partial [Waterburya sp.]